MKSPPAGPGRDGFASSDSSSGFQFGFPVPISVPIPSESSKDLAIRPNPYFTREVSGAYR